MHLALEEHIQTACLNRASQMEIDKGKNDAGRINLGNNLLHKAENSLNKGTFNSAAVGTNRIPQK